MTLRLVLGAENVRLIKYIPSKFGNQFICNCFFPMFQACSLQKNDLMVAHYIFYRKEGIWTLMVYQYFTSKRTETKYFTLDNLDLNFR